MLFRMLGRVVSGGFLNTSSKKKPKNLVGISSELEGDCKNINAMHSTLDVPGNISSVLPDAPPNRTSTTTLPE